MLLNFVSFNSWLLQYNELPVVVGVNTYEVLSHVHGAMEVSGGQTICPWQIPIAHVITIICEVQRNTTYKQRFLIFY